MTKGFADGTTLHLRLDESGLCVHFEMQDTDGDVEIEGSINWDGCVNWHTNPRLLFHFCEPSDAYNLADKFKSLWAESKAIMPKAIF